PGMIANKQSRAPPAQTVKCLTAIVELFIELAPVGSSHTTRPGVMLSSALQSAPCAKLVTTVRRTTHGRSLSICNRYGGRGTCDRFSRDNAWAQRSILLAGSTTHEHSNLDSYQRQNAENRDIRLWLYS